jgi:protein SCO1/2
MKFKVIIFGLVLSLILIGSGYILWPVSIKTKQLTDFKLTQHQGKAFTLAHLKGKWSFIFFGYTHCPDICPVTLTLLREVKQKLAPYPKYLADTQYIFVSVDGQRDTPEKLAEYVNYFDPQFIGASGTEEQVNALTRQLGIVYIRQPEATAGQYFIDHSATIVLINPQGEIAAQFMAPHAVATIVERYIKIRQPEPVKESS